MMRHSRKYRPNIPNRLAMLAALVLVTTSLFGLNGSAVPQVAQSPGEESSQQLASAEQDAGAVEETTEGRRKLNFSLLLFRTR